MAENLIGQGYSDAIGTRQGTEGQTEFFNKQSGIGFERPIHLSEFLNTQFGANSTTENVFDVLKVGRTMPAPMTGPATPLQLGGTMPGPGANQAGALVANAGTTSKSLQDYINELTPPKTELQGRQDAILARIDSLLPQTGGKAQAQGALEAKAGIPEMQKQLQSILGDIQVKNAEYEKLFTDIEGKPIALEFQTGQIAQTQKQQASTIGLLSARAQALQGNIQLAQDTASRAIDLQYSVVEDEMNIRMKQLQLIEPMLTREQSIVAEARQRQYQEQQQTLAEKKSEQKTNVVFALENNIQTQFYTRGGTVIRTSDGFAFSTPEEAFAAGVKEDFSNAPVITPISEQQRGFENSLALENIGLNREQFEFAKYQFQKNYSLDLEKFSFEQQLAILKNQEEQNKPLTADELLKFGGLPAGTTWEDITQAGLTPQKSATEAQLKAATYADRIKQAIDIFDGLENKIAAINGFNYSVQRRLPNIAPGKSDTVKAQQQAEDNFLNAVLRQESGAAIADSERENGRRQYFPQPGDSKEVLANKKKNRQIVLEGMARQAGPAYQGQQSLNELERDFSRAGNALDSGFIGPVPYSYNKANSKTLTSAQKLPTGTSVALASNLLALKPPGSYPSGKANNLGNQCGYFVRSIVEKQGYTYPRVGDSLSEKTAAVKKSGVTKDKLSVGSVIVTSENTENGHIAYIIGKNEKGWIVAESNFNFDEKVSYGRVIPYTSKSVIGGFNPTLNTKTA